jgi:2-dehydro-3-deoxygalactonokinase
VAIARFIAGDWGTSHLRLFLCDASGAALDGVDGPGAAAAAGRFAEIFEDLTARWSQRHGALPAVLSGMVGSSFGWLQAPYVRCPARPEEIARGAVRVPGDSIHLVPGLSCRNRLDAPDFLRGEETQVMGAVQLETALRRGSHLLCLPGTHTKWVTLVDGAIHEFLTAPTGELFALLREHSVLVRSPPGIDSPPGGTAFQQGLDRFNERPQIQLLHRLFECRSRQLGGELTAQESGAFLSGLLIASDIGGALPLMPQTSSSSPVFLIGAPQLTALYASGLAAQGRATKLLDGAQASLAGLAYVHQQLTTRTTADAAG